MTHSFEIKVQCKGSAVGTLGWLNSLLADGELVIKECKDGRPAMFFHELHDQQGNERPENAGNYFICKVSTYKDEPELYHLRNINGVNLAATYLEADEYRSGFVSYPISKAAEVKLEEFIYNACEEFVNWWNNQ